MSLTPEERMTLERHGWREIDKDRGWWRREETLRGHAEAADMADYLITAKWVLTRLTEDL